VPIEGTRNLGPDNARLTVHTKRTGKVAKAGHDLTIEVTSWEGALDLGEQPSVSLDVDSTAMKVLEGHGGIQSLDDGDKDNISQTIDDEVLLKRKITFRSTDVQADGGHLHVTGDLTLMTNTRPLTFDLELGDDGKLSGSAVVKQTEWGMKPYTALFGALKVADEVEIRIDSDPLA
jgi:hypothetical protein